MGTAARSTSLACIACSSTSTAGWTSSWSSRRWPESPNFSSFHFHRLFTAWFGETLGEYVRRRRLETAALRLVAQPRLPVLQVALSVGFGSTEAFARAFKARFGSTPTAWRVSQRTIAIS
ncbi:MAG TPA: AraC family transcriptional regulator [Candidatus Dormibacteraeota bacterium]